MYCIQAIPSIHNINKIKKKLKEKKVYNINVQKKILAAQTGLSTNEPTFSGLRTGQNVCFSMLNSTELKLK